MQDFLPRGRIFAKFSRSEDREFDHVKQIPRRSAGGCSRLEMTDALPFALRPLFLPRICCFVLKMVIIYL